MGGGDTDQKQSSSLYHFYIGNSQIRLRVTKNSYIGKGGGIGENERSQRGGGVSKTNSEEHRGEGVQNRKI